MWWDNIPIDENVRNMHVGGLDIAESVLLEVGKVDTPQARYLGMQAAALYADYVTMHYIPNLSGKLPDRLAQLITLPDVTAMACTIKDVYDTYVRNPVLPDEKSILYPWQAVGFMSGVLGDVSYRSDFQLMRSTVEEHWHPGDMMLTDLHTGMLYEIHKNR